MVNVGCRCQRLVGPAQAAQVDEYTVLSAIRDREIFAGVMWQQAPCTRGTLFADS